MPVTVIFSVPVHHDCSGKDNFNLRMPFKERPHCLQGAKKVLFIAIEMSKYLPFCAPITPIDSIVHTGVLFDKRANAAVVRQPILSAIVRARVLNNVLELDTLLVGD